MARVKAIFDADILIHLVKTNALEFAFTALGAMYISEYVYNQEIRKDTVEGRSIEKLKNSGRIQVLTFDKLTKAQKRIYMETYKLLKKENISGNPINEGERVTASFSRACNIYYYMSDDNKASSHIKSLTSVDIVNFCDILFMQAYIFGEERKAELKECYNRFVSLYDTNRIPKVLQEKGVLRSFGNMMGFCYDKFHKNDNLKRLLESVSENMQDKQMLAVDEIDK